MALNWFEGYVSILFLTEGFWFFVSGSVTGDWEQPVRDCRSCEAERNQNKPNGLHLSVKRSRNVIYPVTSAIQPSNNWGLLYRIGTLRRSRL